MKTSILVLSASVVLNLALLGTIAVGVAGDSRPATETKAPPPAAATAPAPSNPGPETWTALQTGDLAAQRDRLRSEGFPDAVIRAIISAQIGERYAAQRKALENRSDQPYWKQSSLDPKTVAALRDLSRAQREELRALLGPDPENYRVADIRRQYPGLALEKAEDLAAIVERYNEKRQELYSGPVGGVDREKMLELEKAMRAEFAGVLTPQELEEYDLRASRTATQLQYNLSAFDPTEAEYRTLYKLQSAFDEQYSPLYSQMTPEQMRNRSAAQKQLQDDIKAALGTDRYAQYEKATDYNYRQTTQLVARLQLPAETADNLYAVQKEYQQKQRTAMESLRNNSGGRDEMVQQLTALQQEATAKVNTLFNGNAQALDAYQRYGGQWLRNMVPRMSRTPSAGGSFDTTTRIGIIGGG